MNAADTRPDTHLAWIGARYAECGWDLDACPAPRTTNLAQATCGGCAEETSNAQTVHGALHDAGLLAPTEPEPGRRTS